MKFRAVSLFANCGAGDVGYRRAGFSFDVIAELEQRRINVARLNHSRAVAVQGDLRETLPKVISAWRASNGQARPALLAACPPCQGMSSARGGRGSESDPYAGSRDPRNLLAQVIIRAVDALRPRVVVVENVPAFLTRQVLHPETGSPISAAALLVEALKEYAAFPIVTDLADFGVPQARKRSFITFIHRDEPGLAILSRLGLVPYPRPTHARAHVSVTEALAHLNVRSLDASRHDLATDPAEPMHGVPVWDEARHRMVQEIPPGSGNAAWANNRCFACGAHSDDEDAATCALCDATLLRPVVTDPDGQRRLVSGFRRSSYRRMNPDKPAATITTASGRVGSDRTIHPTETRVLSPLECQTLQTFPSDFRWGDALVEHGHTHVRAMIGEAVPPLFTSQHGRVLAALLRGARPYRVMPSADERHVRGSRALEKAQVAAKTTVSAVLADPAIAVDDHRTATAV